jgi:hypothetical protein
MIEIRLSLHIYFNQRFGLLQTDLAEIDPQLAPKTLEENKLLISGISEYLKIQGCDQMSPSEFLPIKRNKNGKRKQTLLAELKFSHFSQVVVKRRTIKRNSKLFKPNSNINATSSNFQIHPQDSRRINNYK